MTQLKRRRVKRSLMMTWTVARGRRSREMEVALVSARLWGPKGCVSPPDPPFGAGRPVLSEEEVCR